MRTSPKNRAAQSGFTLTELLITLAVLSLLVGLSNVSLRQHMPALAVASAVSTLESDLKQARLLAVQSGDDVVIVATENGYRIEKLEISRTFDRGLSLIWHDRETITFRASGWHDSGHISIRKGGAENGILIDPLTGKIIRV